MRGASTASNTLYITVFNAIATASDRIATVVNPLCRPRVLAATRRVERSIRRETRGWEEPLGAYNLGVSAAVYSKVVASPPPEKQQTLRFAQGDPMNVKLALRTLFKTPFVTTVAALSLALGIGANTAIYSSYDAMLRRPLPVYQPERLANFIAPGPQDGSNNCNQSGSCIEVLSYPMFKDLEKNPGLFSGIAGHRIFGVNLAFEDQTPINAEAGMVSGSYFPVLGLQPYRGRLIGPADDDVIGAHFVAVL